MKLREAWPSLHHLAAELERVGFYGNECQALLLPAMQGR